MQSRFETQMNFIQVRKYTIENALYMYRVIGVLWISARCKRLKSLSCVPLICGKNDDIECVIVDLWVLSLILHCLNRFWSM